jgi:septum formation protein
MSVQIILASASPRRKELLAQLNIIPIIYPVDLDETPFPEERPLAYVQRIAAEKSAKCAIELDTNLPILAADTSVVLGDRILGKPQNKAASLAMLMSLSGRAHHVYTAISLRGKQHWNTVSVTEVTFRTITEPEMEAYWLTDEPADKAGGYAIQGLGSLFVESIKGSYSGVMGLPLYETGQLLAEQGIDLLS